MLLQMVGYIVASGHNHERVRALGIIGAIREVDFSEKDCRQRLRKC